MARTPATKVKPTTTHSRNNHAAEDKKAKDAGRLQQKKGITTNNPCHRPHRGPNASPTDGENNDPNNNPNAQKHCSDFAGDDVAAQESDNDSGKQSDKATDNDAEGSTAEGLLPLMERPNGHSKAPPKGRRGPMMRSKKPVAAASSIDDDNSLPPAKKLAASQKGGCAGWAAVGNGPMSEGPARSSIPFEVSNRIRELERQLQEEKEKNHLLR